MSILPRTRTLILNLILKYKSLPVLWKKRGYKDERMEKAAYEELLQVYKDNGFPNAYLELVKWEMQRLITAFSIEYKKVRILGRAYKPKYWFYKHLLFIENQDSDADSDEDEIIKVESSSEDSNGLEERYYLDEHYIDEENEEEPPQKRHKNLQENQLENDKNPSDLTKAEVVGLNITKKISCMHPTQAIYAEALITNVLKRGLLEQLHQRTELCNSVCDKRSSPS